MWPITAEDSRKIRTPKQKTIRTLIQIVILGISPSETPNIVQIVDTKPTKKTEILILSRFLFVKELYQLKILFMINKVTSILHHIVLLCQLIHSVVVCPKNNYTNQNTMYIIETVIANYLFLPFPPPSSFGGWIVENLKALEWTGASLVYVASNLSTSWKSGR